MGGKTQILESGGRTSGLPLLCNLGQLHYPFLHQHKGDNITYFVGLLEELNKNDVYKLPYSVSDL